MEERKKQQPEERQTDQHSQRGQICSPSGASVDRGEGDKRERKGKRKALFPYGSVTYDASYGLIKRKSAISKSRFEGRNIIGSSQIVGCGTGLLSALLLQIIAANTDRCIYIRLTSDKTNGQKNVYLMTISYDEIRTQSVN